MVRYKSVVVCEAERVRGVESSENEGFQLLIVDSETFEGEKNGPRKQSEMN